MEKYPQQQQLSEEEEDFADITLRPLNIQSDIDDCMEWLTDEDVSKFCSWDCFKSKESATKYIQEVALPHPWFRAICLKDKAIGSISVTPKSGNDRCRAEVGYLVASKYWGKGIATKSVKMAAESIFVEWASHLQRLEALVDVENLGSQKVLEKAGFSRDGVLRKYFLLKGKMPRDIVMFSLLSPHPTEQ